MVKFVATLFYGDFKGAWINMLTQLSISFTIKLKFGRHYFFDYLGSELGKQVEG